MHIIKSLGLSLLLATPAALLASPAAAQDADSRGHLGVLPVLDPVGQAVGLMSVEGAASAAAVDAAQTRGATVVLPKVMKTYLDDSAAKGRQCKPTEAECLAAVGLSAKVPKIMVTVLEPKDDGIWFETALLDVAEKRFERRERKVLPLDADAVPAAVEGQIALLLNTWRPDVKADPAVASQVVVGPQATGFIDGLGLVRAILLWPGVVLGGGGVATMMASGAFSSFALGSYYYGGGFLNHDLREGLYFPGVVGAWVGTGAVGVAVVGTAMATAGLLFFVPPDQEEGDESEQPESAVTVMVSPVPTPMRLAKPNAVER